MVNPGAIFRCDFGTPIGHEAAFERPALVLSPDELNRHGIVIVLPITRTARGYPTHVELEHALPVTSYVQCELIRAVSTDRLIRQVATADAVDLERVRQIVSRLLGIGPSGR